MKCKDKVITHKGNINKLWYDQMHSKNQINYGMIRCILKDTQNILLFVHSLINLKKLNFTLYIVTKIKVLFEYFKKNNGSFLCVSSYTLKKMRKEMFGLRENLRENIFLISRTFIP